jgi:hypothetical protein
MNQIFSPPLIIGAIGVANGGDFYANALINPPVDYVDSPLIKGAYSYPIIQKMAQSLCLL